MHVYIPFHGLKNGEFNGKLNGKLSYALEVIYEQLKENGHTIGVGTDDRNHDGSTKNEENIVENKSNGGDTARFKKEAEKETQMIQEAQVIIVDLTELDQREQQSKQDGKKDQNGVEDGEQKLLRWIKIVQEAHQKATGTGNNADDGDISGQNRTTNSQVMIVGISSVMTWGQTQAQGKKHRPLREANYKSRKANERYKRLRMFETLLLEAGNADIQTVIIATGIMYGRGEHALHSLFRDAWLGASSLPILGNGKNTLPTIHVQDMATIVRLFIENPSDIEYFVATDASLTTQKQLVTAISSGLSTGHTHILDINDEAVLLHPDNDMFLSNMIFEPEYIRSLAFDWIAPEGLPSSFDLVRSEFVRDRGLRPVRIVILGPPGAGKTYHADQLAKAYYIKRVDIGSVIEEALARHDELSEQMHASLAESANTMKLSKTAKKQKHKRHVSGIFEQSSPRIASELIVEAVKRKLLEPECRNRGFVLDGYPKLAEEARMLFSDSTSDSASDDDIAVDQLSNFVKDQTIWPNAVIMLEASQSYCESRFKSLSTAQTIEGHNDEDGFNRRWSHYATINDSELDPPISALSFFTTHIEVLMIPEERLLHSVQFMAIAELLIDKNGKAFNYHPTPEEEAEEKARQAAEAAAAAEQEAALKRSLAEQEQQSRAQRESENAALWEQVQRDQAQLVESCSQTFRDYLMEHIMPDLTECLLKVSQMQPEDPIDYLAECLIERVTARENSTVANQSA